MPKPTQTGANNMYAKVNGQPWQPKGCIGGCSQSFLIRYDQIKFSLTGGNIDQKIYIDIILSDLKTTGTYELSNQGSNYAYLYNNTENVRYYTTSNSRGSINITKLDKMNKIISGTFEFTAEDEDNPQHIVNVSSGWFDGKYEF